MSPSSRNPQLIRHKKAPKSSAVLLLLYLKKGEWHLALTKRHTYKGNHSAQISLPGGKIEDKDKSLLACALRETYEEVGIVCSEDVVIGELSPLYIPISNYMVQPFVATVDFEPHFVTDHYEVKHLIELPLAYLLNEEYKSHCELISQEQHISTPVYQLENDYIWGATAMILSELAEIIKYLNLKP